MIRKQIYLSAKADRLLSSEAKRRHVSQAAVIREKLDSSPPSDRARLAPDERARAEALAALRKLKKSTAAGVGADRKFKREDAYAERLQRFDPRRYERSRLRG